MPGLDVLSDNPRFVFSPLQLSAIAITIESAHRIYQVLTQSSPLVQCLQSVAQPICDVDLELQSTIQNCIRVKKFMSLIQEVKALDGRLLTVSYLMQPAKT